MPIRLPSKALRMDANDGVRNSAGSAPNDVYGLIVQGRACLDAQACVPGLGAGCERSKCHSFPSGHTADAAVVATVL
jgi:hypothetical protein